MTFRSAVDATPDLEGAWLPGLQALGYDGRHVRANEPRTIAGSVNIEKCLIKLRKSRRHWDYAVGHRPKNRTNDVAYWIEVHPAHDREIKVVKQKLSGLLDWLRTSAPRLREMDATFVWVSSGGTTFTKRSKQLRQLADEGIDFWGGVFKIPDQFAERGHK